MQREEFVQQLWLDYVHTYPDIGALPLWPADARVDYLALVTLDQGPFATKALLPKLGHMGYRLRHQQDGIETGCQLTALSPPGNEAWLVLIELNTKALQDDAGIALSELVNQAHPQDCKGHNLLCRGRPWPMPSWERYLTLNEAHPLAGWLAIMGPRIHHAGFDCRALGSSLDALDSAFQATGMESLDGSAHGLFPAHPALVSRFYPTLGQKVIFGHGDEHRLCLGGLGVNQVCASDQRRGVEVMWAA